MFKTEMFKNMKVDRPYFTNTSYREAGRAVSMIDNGRFRIRNVTNDTEKLLTVIKE